MFGKYIKINLKKHPWQYLFIIVFEIFLLLAILVSNGIYLNSVTEKDHSQARAKWFEFLVGSGSKKSSEISAKIEEFADRLPYNYNYLFISITSDTDNKNDKYGRHSLFLFSDYEHMKKHLLKYFVKSEADLPTEEEFLNRSKTVLVGSSAGLMESIHDENGEIVFFTPEYQFDENGDITIFGEKYKVSGRYNGNGVVMFWGSQPENTSHGRIELEMDDIMNEKQIQEIYDLFVEIFGDTPRYSKLPDVKGLLEQRTTATNIIVSLLLIIISVLNIMLVFRYLLSSKKNIFAVFRFCGFNKSVCLKYSFAEFMLISLISSAASIILFNQIIKPFMTNYYSIFGTVFTIEYYLFLSGLFIAACAAMFFVYIAPSLSKSVTAELREI